MRKRVCTKKLLKDMVNLSFSGSPTICRLSLPEDLWTLTVDEGQIAQVIYNLLINAAQATGGTGSIEVGAENVMISGDEDLPLAGGPYVRISVIDQGSGIAAEDMKRIFNPYFTTEPAGKGLGLTIAQTLVQKHGGHIIAESKEGKTTLSVYLPASPRTRAGGRSKRDAEVTTVQEASGKILVVDDQESIRMVAKQILTGLGHEVAVAANGSEATELFKEAEKSGHPFDLVILDLTMARGPGGEDTLKKLQETDPSVRAIVSSGYYDDPVMDQFEAFGFAGRLRKPYTMGELSRAVDAALPRAS